MKKIYLPSGMRDNILSEAKTKKNFKIVLKKFLKAMDIQKSTLLRLNFFQRIKTLLAI